MIPFKENHFLNLKSNIYKAFIFKIETQWERHSLSGDKKLSEEKFIICPNCGAILEKEVQFCGFCGSDVNEKKSSYTQPQKPSYRQPSTQQYGAHVQSALGQQPVYVVGATTQQQQAEAKLRLAGTFAWLTFCGGSIIFLFLTIYYAMGAKKLGSTSPRIRQSIIVAVIGTLLSIGSIILYFWFFWDGFPF